MKINWKAVPDAVKVLSKLGEKHLPTILTGIGVAGFIGTAIMAAKEAPKAESAIRKAQKDLECPEAKYADDEKTFEIRTLTKWEKVKITAGYYWPSVALGAASTACILSAHKIDLTRLASITAAYQLSKKDLKDLKDKIIEKDGEEKLKEYRTEVHKQYIEPGPPTAIYDTGKGTTIFYDPTSGWLFYSDIWHVRRELDALIRGCRVDSAYALSDLRHGLGLPKNKTEDDYEFNWESVKDIDEDNIEKYFFEYHAVNADEGDMRPCIWLDIADRMYNRYDYPDDYTFRRR